MTTAEALSLENLSITDTSRYVARGYPWAEFDLLRREAPIYWYDRPDVEPFWAVARYEDVLTVSKHSDVFVNTQRLRIFPKAQEVFSRRRREELEREFGDRARRRYTLSFIDMDDPEHAAYRNLTNRQFTPRAMRALEGRFAELARGYVDAFEARLREGGAVDLVHGLSIMLPMTAIFQMVGYPPEDWNQLFAWKEVEFGSDEDLVDRMPDPEERHLARRAAGSQSNAYVLDFLAKRQAAGADTNCIADLLLRASLDGHRLEEDELLSYMNLLLAGGLETTRNATTGGVLALLEHPDQLERLVADRELLPPAVEEILRWVSPVIQFARTAVADFDLAGQRIAAGETVAMWYPSANRDEAVFDDPYRFDIGRQPNDHLAFGGYGAHFCLGANLARWQLRAIFAELLRILPDLELAGPPRRQDSLHVGGFIRMPVRLRS